MLDYEKELRLIDADFYSKFLELVALTRRLADVPGKFWLESLSPNAVMMVTMVNALKIAFAENRNSDLYDALEDFFRESEEHGHLVDDPPTNDEMDAKLLEPNEDWPDQIGG